MKGDRLRPLACALAATAMGAAQTLEAAPPAPPWFTWTTVVNNTDLMPTDDERCLQTPTPRRCFFNSYNQPSVNVNGLVVIRARSRGATALPGRFCAASGTIRPPYSA